MSERRRDERDEGLPVSPRALGIAFGMWIALMLVLAFVVVPALFASCTPGS